MSVVKRVVESKIKDLGAFQVRRPLPRAVLRSVGPWVFFDHFGPVAVEPDGGMNVRPHPHIGLATVTYLFEGAVQHRDSLGTEIVIEPGAINWMTAGRGIVHSERMPPFTGTMRLHGLQLWLALPVGQEDVEPAFHHHNAVDLPVVEPDEGVRIRVLIGSAHGATSPVATFAPTLYLDVALEVSTEWVLPAGEASQERAIYVVSGEVVADGHAHGVGSMLVLEPGVDVTVRALEDAQLAVIGGAPLDGPRLMYWNFVHSSRERLERAKRDWKNGDFPLVPNDEGERIPLPEEAPHIEHIPSHQEGEVVGEMTWVWSDATTMDIVHTGVRDVLRGGGWARKLVMRGVAYAREHGVRILPHCSYARKVLTSDEALADVLVADWEVRL